MSRIVDTSQQKIESGVLSLLMADRRPQDFENDMKIMEIKNQQYSTKLSTGTYTGYGTGYDAYGTIMNALSGIHQDYWLRIYENKKNAEDLLRSFRFVTIQLSLPEWSLDSDVQSMALKKNLLPYVSQLRNTILETYRGVIFVNSKLIEDPEAPDYERISFEIHLTGEPTQILKDEKAFHTIFFQKVPDEKQKFFTFTYRVL
jgi:hypothetical protein